MYKTQIIITENSIIQDIYKGRRKVTRIVRSIENEWVDISQFYRYTGGIAISTNSLFPSGDRTSASIGSLNPLFYLRIYCFNPPDSHINDKYDKMREAAYDAIENITSQQIGSVATKNSLINQGLYNEDGWNRFATVENTKLYYKQGFDLAFARIPKPLSDNSNGYQLNVKFLYNGSDYKIEFV